ncbi:MAG: hypothetical protein ACR2RE_12255 [Geminicoccaceae bacterium]
MQEETAPNVNNVSGLLKAFVILGGVVLVIGMLLLAVMIVIRSTGIGTGAGDAPGRDLVSSGPVDLALPAGVRVGQVVADGKRLVLLGEGPDGQQYIAVVDADSGERKTLIRVTSDE